MTRSLALLNTTDDSVPEGGVLRLALQEAVAEVGGLGGLVPLRRPETTPGLYLAASTGLPPTFTRCWQEIADDAAAAPAAAARLRRPVWFPMPEGPGTGMASVPLRKAQGEPFGALTVVTATPDEPTAGQRDVLRAAAEWAAGRLRPAEPSRAGSETPPGVAGVPDTTGEAGLRRAFGVTGVGAWVWYIGPGVLELDEPSMALLGVDPDAYDGRIETWLSLVHPDDIPWVTAELDKAVSTFGPCDAEYRVCRPDGAVRWIQVRGRVEPDAGGSPHRMLGTAWDTTESRIARDGVRGALRYMRDGFLAVDKAGRIAFANVEAEGLLGSPRLAGRVLWDLLVIRRVPGLESRCRKAAAGTKPAGFDAEWPDTGRWYRFRFVPVPDGLAWYFTDLTRSRERRAEQAAAERAAAERAARIQDLTAALAEAVTSQDVVNAVAERVLPPFGASGLTMQVVEGDRMRVIGAVGYPQPFVDLISGPLRVVTPAAEALRYHRPWFISSPEEYAERYPEFAQQKQSVPSGKQAWAFMPLVVSARLVGLCVVSFDRPRCLTGAERALLIALSGLIAQALERARLFDAEHAQAQALQRALLPQVLPSLPAVTAAARYLPAGPRMDVGGDWYDVIPLSPDRAALAIGDPDAGMCRLAELLRIHHGESLDQLGDSLTRALLPAEQQSTDDAALLVVGVHATARDAIAPWPLREAPQAAGAARQHVRDQLTAWHLDDLAMNTEMLASEMVANVIRHARGPDRLRLLRSRTLICEVFDGSLTTPRMRRASWTDERGRSLQLIAALTDR